MTIREWHTKHRDLGMRDAKGRAIGVKVQCRILEPVEYVAGEREYEVRVQVTRDGATFGALPQSKMVPSHEAAQAEILRRVTAIAKRYAKITNAAAGGYIRRGTDPLSGHQRTVAIAEDTDAGKYEVVCDDHATLVCVDTLRDAMGTSTLDFCDECRDEQERA